MINILILGGGFGGIRAALDLSKRVGHKKDIKITLVDKQSSQTFFPTLYELASVYGVDHQHPFHTKLRGTVSIPYADIFKGKHIDLVEAEIKHINLGGKHVTTNSGSDLPFDYLIIAMGSTVSTFGIPGVEEYAHKFKTLEDGLLLNDKIEDTYIAAGKKEKPLPVHILVGGAGFTGVELAAELSSCTIHIAHRHNVTENNCTAITLLEAGPTILPAISEKERNKIKARLVRLGVNLLENSAIKEVGPDFAKLADGSVLKGDIIIWTAGVRALDILKSIDGLELDEKGRIVVNDFMQTNHPNIFAVGDNINFVDKKTGKSIPQMAYVAIEQGRVAAENVSRLATSKRQNGGEASLKKYDPHLDVWIAPVGGKNAVVHIGGWGRFDGFLGYLVRQLVDLRYFLSVLPFFKGFKLFLEDTRIFVKND
ncbi:MAG: NAD(P)/FAD-dependent oxidoreductase [Candidatus Paceibacterota bacterium]